MSVEILDYSDDRREDVIELILSIQNNEFGVPITLADQPDVSDVPAYYGRGNGAFWVALDGGHVVGTIALLDFGEGRFALRKMFVRQNYRGKEHGVATALLRVAKGWAQSHGDRQIILGTIDGMAAARRFYEKNEFVQVSPDDLPQDFPRMPVDTVFYELKL